MNEQQLSKRLEKVADFVPKGAKVADIGSDHAYLPCYLLLNEKAVFAVAGEITEGPFQSARDQVKAAGLSDQIDVRKGDGLSVVKPGEVNTITICGMGGNLIASILENGKSKLENAERLILQPNVGAITVRKWLLQEGWVLTNEVIIKEGEKIYEILVADRKGEQPYSGHPGELLFGPYLLREKTTIFLEKWKSECDQWKNVLAQMEQSHSEETNQKKARLLEKIKLAEELIL